MKKFFLLLTLLAAPAFAQEEEEIRIELESDENPTMSSVRFTENSTDLIASTIALPNGSVWYRVFDEGARFNEVVYCWINENEVPRCKYVEIDD